MHSGSSSDESAPKKVKGHCQGEVGSTAKTKCKLAAALLQDSTTKEETALSAGDVQHVLDMIEEFSERIAYANTVVCVGEGAASWRICLHR